MSSIKIIFDNAGGVTTQFTDASGKEFACHRFDVSNAADDVLAFLADPDVSSWEGHDEDANSLNPTREEIANGGYRCWYCCDEDPETDAILHEMREAVTQMEQSGWGNSDEFAARMRKDDAFAPIAD